MHFQRLRYWLALPALCLAAQFTTAELEAHKAWMNDAQDKKDDIREALAAKDSKKLVAAATDIEKLTGREQEFWARTKIEKAKEIAARNRAEAQELLRSAQAGRFAEAGEAFASLEHTCSSCHDLHFEKQIGGTPAPVR